MSRPRQYEKETIKKSYVFCTILIYRKNMKKVCQGNKGFLKKIEKKLKGGMK